jgi:integrase
MATLRKRNTKSGFYVVDFSYNGQRHVYSTKTTQKHVADQIRKTIEAHIALGTFNIKNYQRDSLLLKDAIIEYLKDIQVTHAIGTYTNSCHYFVEFEKCLPNRTLSSISYRDLVNWRNNRLNTIRKTTANIERRVIHTFFNWCIKREYIKTNPVSDLSKLTVDIKTRRYLKNDEINKLIKKIDDARMSARGSRDKRFMTHFQLYIMFLIFTGLRRSEALKLQWKDIDFETGVAYVYQNKVHEARELPLHPIALDILHKIGPVLFSKLNAGHVSRKCKYFLKLANLNDFKLHSMRHSYATDLGNHDANLLALQGLLGHADIRTTMMYAKTDINSQRREVNKINRDLPPSDILVTRKKEVEE